MKILTGIAELKYPFRTMFILFSGLIFMSSCTSICFENPQPVGQKNLAEFPKKLVGLYIDVENGDTVVTIFHDGFTIHLNDENVKILLSEKSVLRKYKSYYFLNLRNDEDSLWTVYIADPGKKKTLVLYDIFTGEDQLEQLKAITEVKHKGDAEETFYINPTLEELNRIIKTGLLKPTQKLKK